MLAGQHDDRDCRIALAHFGERREAVAVREIKVEQDETQVIGVLDDERHRLAAVGRLQHVCLALQLFEDAAQCVADQDVIVDHQDLHPTNLLELAARYRGYFSPMFKAPPPQVVPVFHSPLFMGPSRAVRRYQNAESRKTLWRLTGSKNGIGRLPTLILMRAPTGWCARAHQVTLPRGHDPCRPRCAWRPNVLASRGAEPFRDAKAFRHKPSGRIVHAPRSPIAAPLRLLPRSRSGLAARSSSVPRWW